MSSYNTLATARTIAATLNLVKVAAASDDALTAALELAAIDLDSAMRYQGQKYDAAQEREFPRVDGTRIWDLDTDGTTVIVPAIVKTAEVLQAESLLDGTHQKRVEAYAAGLASVGVGAMNKSFRADARPSALSERANRMMQRYRLRSGQLL